jgi:hypothetical protein
LPIDAGWLLPEVIWGALDCPGQFAFYVNGVRTGLLGRITAKVIKPVKASDQIVITGWQINVDGKKHFAGTALFNQAGGVLRLFQTGLDRTHGLTPQP